MNKDIEQYIRDLSNFINGKELTNLFVLMMPYIADDNTITLNKEVKTELATKSGKTFMTIDQDIMDLKRSNTIINLYRSKYIINSEHFGTVNPNLWSKVSLNISYEDGKRVITPQFS